MESYLDFMQIPYKVVEVNPLSKKEILGLEEENKSGEKKAVTTVPVTLIGGEIVSDSTRIIDHVQRLLHIDELDIMTMRRMSEFDSEVSNVWCTWSEKRLAVTLYPNITRSLRDAWDAFGYVSGVET